MREKKLIPEILSRAKAMLSATATTFTGMDGIKFTK
jgi:hypothetical protein